MVRRFLVITGVALLAVTAMLVFRSPSGEAPPPEVGLPSAPPAPAVPIEAPADWREHVSERVGIRFAYAPTLTLHEDAPDQVRLSQWGPTQKGQTELYDGLILSFRRVTPEGSFEAFLEAQMAQFRDVGSITAPLSDTVFNGRPARTFGASGLGDYTLVYVPQEGGAVLEISILAPDPTGAGFRQTADRILSTVSFLP